VLSLSEPGAVVDASKASQFTEYTLSGGTNSTGPVASAITKVADTQTVNVSKDASVSAAGYIPNGGLDANDETVIKTVYAGTLAVKASGAGTTLTASASALNLTISTVPSTTDGVTTSTTSTVTLEGDVKTATITLNNGVDNSKTASADVVTTVTIAPLSTGAGTTGPLTKLGNLTAVTLTGTGSATVDNSGATSKLASIDASGLAGKVTIAGATLGAATAGLTWTAGDLVETVKLGSALDKLTVSTGLTGSTYAKMDSITGFALATDATGVLKASTSDDITIKTSGTTIVGFAKAATGYSTTSLDAALNTLANRESAEKLVFQTNGNTYIFVDAASATTGGVADGDTVIELVGLVDLDNLVLALNS
jgi:hypothetical protein